jgi:SagB-type dehydrogenase family enzyme
VHTIEYHDRTKHHFNRFARSAGHLDWASQPDPFRRFAGAPLAALPRAARPRAAVPFAGLYRGTIEPAALTDATIGDLLRCAFGLSAWKQHQAARWPLRVNPSSGNLHPTEAYLISRGRVAHYAPEDHALEARAELDPWAWPASGPVAGSVLVALTSIAWREAWKYGERAFRYCQHDVGHAIGALCYSAALVGWRVRVLSTWSDADIAALVGSDRDDDFVDAEREWPACLALVTARHDIAIASIAEVASEALVAAARRATWTGRANRLSTSHVDWPAIEGVAVATRYDARPERTAVDRRQSEALGEDADANPSSTDGGQGMTFAVAGPAGPAEIARLRADRPAREVILGRRSAVAFDPRGRLPRAAFAEMLARLRPGRAGSRGLPWDALDEDALGPQVHLCVFVHRIEGLTPGLYAFLRDDAALPAWRAALRSEFLWEPVEHGDLPGLWLLVPSDVTWPANRLSCDQGIAGDGFFSLGMIARFEDVLREQGEWCYRRLFWECGLIGQVLYLEAEAHGVRGTGIGCFYDDAVHDTLGLTGHAWQSLYHFSMGVPVDDSRLTTHPGYDWET